MLILVIPPPLNAQASATDPSATDPLEAVRLELANLRRDYEQRIATLERQLAELQAKAPSPQAIPAAPPTVAQAPVTSAGTTPSPNYFNPAMAVIGNYLAVGGQNRVENRPSSSLRESEVSFQAIVDPYARADFFISYGEQGVDIEEGFLTLTTLPGNFLAQIGRIRVPFGKINTLHLHVLPWPDEPLPIVNLLGREEGWIGTGVSVARLLPLPGDTFSEITAQVFQGDAEGLFQARKRSDLAYNGHYRVFRDLTESTNLDVGFSYAQGSNATFTGAKTRLQALDTTFRWKPLQTASYRSFTFRGELFRSQREQLGGTQRAVGWFVSGDYQLARRWFVGARLEASDRASDSSLRDTGEALLLTFWPSEFEQFRGELRRRRYADRSTANELLMQIQFAIGAHGAHPF